MNYLKRRLRWGKIELRRPLLRTSGLLLLLRFVIVFVFECFDLEDDRLLRRVARGKDDDDYRLFLFHDRNLESELLRDLCVLKFTKHKFISNIFSSTLLKTFYHLKFFKTWQFRIQLFMFPKLLSDFLKKKKPIIRHVKTQLQKN